jgi:broad specificity phosphatase PhoE
MIKTIYAFRHGETDWNKEYRFQGRIDIPLNETGRKQALRLRKFFEKHPVEVVLTSDLSRAVETAKIAMGDREVPFVIEPRIRETNLGEVEGMTHDEIHKKFGVEVLENWRSMGPESWHSRFPGGESKAEHLERIMAGLNEFVTTTEFSRIAVSTHGGSLRRVLHHLHPNVTEDIMVGNCNLYEIKFDPEKGLYDANLNAFCVVD